MEVAEVEVGKEEGGAVPSWMDVTNLLARSFSTEGSTRDKDG